MVPAAPELFQPFLMPACVDSTLLPEELPASKTDGRTPAVKLCLYFHELVLMPGLPLLYVMDPLFYPFDLRVEVLYLKKILVLIDCDLSAFLYPESAVFGLCFVPASVVSELQFFL